MDTSAYNNSSTRDPHALNAYVVKTEWESVIAEADGLHTPKVIWEFFNNIYDFILHYCYVFLAMILGGFVSIVMAIVFAIVGFFHVWLITPMLRLLRISCTPVHTFLEIMTQLLVKPCGQCCKVLKAVPMPNVQSLNVVNDAMEGIVSNV